MQVGDIISAYEDQNGISIHRIGEIDEVNDLVRIEIEEYTPEHPEFEWALETLKSLG